MDVKGPTDTMKSARLRENCQWEHTSDHSACVRGAVGDSDPESWVTRSRLRDASRLLWLSLSWAVWEGKELQTGRKTSAPGEKAQAVQQAGDPCGSMRGGDS